MRNGFSRIPPPEIDPILALQLPFRRILFPERRRTTDPDSVFVYNNAEVPAVFAIVPPSPKFLSMLQIEVPSGISFNCKIFPSSIVDLEPIEIF